MYPARFGWWWVKLKEDRSVWIPIAYLPYPVKAWHLGPQTDDAAEVVIERDDIVEVGPEIVPPP